MIKMHRTIQRFVAVLMLLSMAAMFGAGNLPASYFDESAPAIENQAMAEMALDGEAQVKAHDCCDKDKAAGMAGSLSCSADCSYYLAPESHVLSGSVAAYGEGVIHALFKLRRTSFLRPPIV